MTDTENGSTSTSPRNGRKKVTPIGYVFAVCLIVVGCGAALALVSRSVQENERIVTIQFSESATASMNTMIAQTAQFNQTATRQITLPSSGARLATATSSATNTQPPTITLTPTLVQSCQAQLNPRFSNAPFYTDLQMPPQMLSSDVFTATEMIIIGGTRYYRFLFPNDTTYYLVEKSYVSFLSADCKVHNDD